MISKKIKKEVFNLKKSLLIVSLSFVLILLIGTCAMADSTLKFSYDLAGTDKFSAYSSIDLDTETGLSIGYEYTKPNDKLEYGFGLEYQLNRKIKDTEAEFNFIPIYGLINYNFSDNDIKPYITGRFGFDIHNGNSAYKGTSDFNPGIYYAIGGGVSFSNMKFEVIYSVANSSYTYLGTDVDIAYSTTSLVFGYKF
jgi:hypothetical protein